MKKKEKLKSVVIQNKNSATMTNNQILLSDLELRSVSGRPTPGVFPGSGDKWIYTAPQNGHPTGDAQLWTAGNWGASYGTVDGGWDFYDNSPYNMV